MRKSGSGIVRIFKQKFFLNYLDSLRNFLMRFIRSMKKCSTLDVGLKKIIRNTEIVCTCGYHP